MDSELDQAEAASDDEMQAEAGDGEAIAGKKKGDDEDGIIAVLIG